MSRLLPLFSALVLLLLPSCMYWDIGGNIRGMAEHHLGGDVSTAITVDTEVVAECRYHEAPPVVSLWTPHGGIDTRKYGLEYTGKYRVCSSGKYRLCSSGKLSRWYVGEIWDGAPPDEPLPESVQRLHVEPVVGEKDKELVERSSWYPVAAAVAAPFDYAIDPALSLVTSPFALLYVLVVNVLP